MRGPDRGRTVQRSWTWLGTGSMLVLSMLVACTNVTLLGQKVPVDDAGGLKGTVLVGNESVASPDQSSVPGKPVPSVSPSGSSIPGSGSGNSSPSPSPLEPAVLTLVVVPATASIGVAVPVDVDPALPTSVKLAATVTLSNGSKDNRVSWRSLNEAEISVDENGLVRAVGDRPTRAYVEASRGGQVVTIEIELVSKAALDVALDDRE